MGFYLRAGLLHDRWKAARLATNKVNKKSHTLASGLRSEYCNHSWLDPSWVPPVIKGCNSVSEIRPLSVPVLTGLGTRCNDWVFIPSLSSLRGAFCLIQNVTRFRLLFSCRAVSDSYTSHLRMTSTSSLPHLTRPCWDAEIPPLGFRVLASARTHWILLFCYLFLSWEIGMLMNHLFA